MGTIGVLLAQFDVPENRVLHLEDDTMATGTGDDPHGCFLSFGGEKDNGGGELTIFLPDETIRRLLLAILATAPRLGSRTLDRARDLIGEKQMETVASMRARLDPGPPLET